MGFLSRCLRSGGVAGAFLLVLALACGGGYGSRMPAGALEVDNNGTSTMVDLFVTPSSSQTWGVDQLAPAALVPGSSLTLTNVFPDNYDIKAVYADGSVDRIFGVLVQDRTTTVVSSMNSGTGTVVVTNNTGLTITGVFLTPSSANTWGPDQTGGTPLLNGQSLTLTGVAPDTYDLRVTYANGAFQDAAAPVVVSAGNVATIQFN